MQEPESAGWAPGMWSGRQFLAFLAVGTVAVAVDSAVFFSLSLLVGLHHQLANVAGFAVGSGVDYLLCRRLVFARKEASMARQYARFLGVALSTMAVSGAVLAVLVDLGLLVWALPGLSHAWVLAMAKGAAIAVASVWDYVAMKTLVFEPTWKTDTRRTG